MKKSLGRVHNTGSLCVILRIIARNKTISFHKSSFLTKFQETFSLKKECSAFLSSGELSGVENSSKILLFT